MARLAFLIGLLGAPALFAQAAPNPPWTTLTLTSAILGEPRTIFVITPVSYAKTPRRFPVLILLDADDQDQLSAAVANIRFLSGRAAIPELILVGIVNGKDRGHDLSPVATGTTAKRMTNAGGASAFLDFVLREAMPEIRAKYRTLPGTFLAGHSLGGLVALHAASNRTDFAGLIAMSPSLWWNDSTAAPAYADSLARITHPLRLFITSGEFEPGISPTAHRMVARLDSLKPTVLSYQYRHYIGANHGMTPLESLIDGVQYLFEPMSMARLPISRLGQSSDSSDVMRAYLESRRTYVAGARALGFDVNALPEEQVNNLGYGVLQFLKLPNLAVWLFRENVRDYPESANAYDSLGDALLAAGDTTSAIAQFRQSLTVARQGSQSDTTATKKKLSTLTRPPVN